MLASLKSTLRTIQRRAAISVAAPARARRRKAASAYFNAQGASPASSASSAVARLREDGFASWTLKGTLKDGLLTAYAELLQDREAGTGGQVERSTGKAFFEELLTKQDLRTRTALIDTALEPSLLETVAAATGMVPHLESIEIIRSWPVGEESASRLWHRDVNDDMIVKLFVYLNDVSEANGPFTYIPASASRKVPTTLPHYIPDSQIDGYLKRDEWRSVKGAAGTAFLIDTHRCLHFGSRCTQPRIAYIATYSSGLKFMKYAREWNSILAGSAERMSRLQRMVCGLEAI